MENFNNSIFKKNNFKEGKLYKFYWNKEYS